MPPAVAALAVAVSGGRDSVALLHATARAARTLGLQVHALHVQHGLVAQADDWLRRLRAQCQRWRTRGLPITFHAQRLNTSPAPGDSIEAWAREQRYHALAELASAAGCSLVLLAHHRRDQAETLLLQALRGGGPAALAAMPAAALRAGISWQRPWLAQPREAIEAYVRRHRLSYVDDASNDNERLARNRLRRQVWPALSAAFADAEVQLAGAAARAAEAAACLAELGAADLAPLLAAGALQRDAWCRLSVARRALALRCWLGGPESLVQRLLRELPTARQGRWPAPAGELLLYDGLLQRVPLAPSALNRAAQEPTTRTLDLSVPGRHAVPDWGGELLVEPVASGGIAAHRLRDVSLRARAGGEQFQFSARSQPRSLKKQFQLRRVPAWQRSGPLLFDADELLFVPGLGIDARLLAAAGEAQFSLVWQPVPGR